MVCFVVPVSSRRLSLPLVAAAVVSLSACSGSGTGPSSHSLLPTAAVRAARHVPGGSPTLGVLYDFPLDQLNGADPYRSTLIQATDGNFYGTTLQGGAYTGNDWSSNYGTVYKIDTSGNETVVHSFCSQAGCPDGDNPAGGVIQASDGNFYGTAMSGGANGIGDIYRVTPSGDFTVLYSFSQSASSYPQSGLLQASNGDLYGGSPGGPIFKITLKGKYSVVYTFVGGTGPTGIAGPLIQASNGDLYGATQTGGAHDQGSIFRLTLAGKYTLLYSFGSQPNCADGAQPTSGLVQGADGNFYGTTVDGGPAGCGSGTGTIFKITPKGKFTSLYGYPASEGNWDPNQLMQATDGNFYATTNNGGIGGGVVFQFAPGGTPTTLLNFGEPNQSGYGSHPTGGLLQSTNGTLYGNAGGSEGTNSGAIFTVSIGAQPFVAMTPTFGKAGTKVIILGTNLSGSTSVTFDGKAATFTVVSASEITTTVPAGATTGPVQVATPGGNLASNVDFTVAK